MPFLPWMSPVSGVFASLLLAACLSPEGPGCLCAPPVAPIVPLATGNAWTYTDSIRVVTATDTILTLDSLRASITDVRTESRPSGPHDMFVWNVHDRTSGAPSALNLLVENRADGHYTVGAEQDTARFTREILHVKHPAVTGERYAAAFLSFRDSAGHLLPEIDEIEIEVVRADTTCTVPAGTFDCIQYRGRRAGTVFADSWYAPGIGWLGSLTVRRDTLDGIPRDIAVRRVLRAYVLMPR